MTTVSNPELGTSDLVGAASEREAAPSAPIRRKSEVTLRDIQRRALAYFTPPDIFSGTPDSLPKLRAYARKGGWTTEHGALRSVGVTWWRLVAQPATVVCRYVEWIAQRPGRAVPVYLLWKLFIRNAPGPWVAGHIIEPAAHIAGWIFL